MADASAEEYSVYFSEMAIVFRKIFWMCQQKTTSFLCFKYSKDFFQSSDILVVVVIIFILK